MPNRYFSSYGSFKNAVKKLCIANGIEYNPKETIIGDKDIAHYYLRGVAHCEWDGEQGIIEPPK